MEIEPIAYIRPARRGGSGSSWTVVFEPEYRDRNALRDIEGFSHLWLIWGSDERTSLDPSGLALTAVALEDVEAERGRGCVLHVSADGLVDGVPVYDVKPYIPYTDARGEMD